MRESGVGVDVINCRDHREFLSRVLEIRRKRNSSLSLRQFALESGLASPAALSMVINGKRKFTLSLASRVVDAFKLSGKRKQIVLCWAQIDSAKSEEIRQRAKLQLAELVSESTANSLTGAQLRFLSSWFYTALYAMAAQPGCSSDPSVLAKSLGAHLGKKVSASDVQKAIEDMARLELVAVDGTALKQLAGRLSTPEDIRDVSVRQYHSNMIQLALAALQLPLEQREMNGVTVSVPGELIPEVKSRIRAFRKELNELLSKHSKRSDVYQINIQFFPLTRSERGEH